ncbi:excinuclease ABC subunit B [candidate division TA06 bacterium B3_TA06]|uniref:UvrABC system protein B n=1 Tax=candidate division TA06 bacterium B3_TA06 TaxID=2012487 RepID=A0A532VAK7_UNCT6|nr:MAG: excinuclease ABC subunit B [candidate division TA06 bacterium B3_TA06]
MPEFKLVTDMTPAGDQPQAIRELVNGINRGDKHQTLLGVTGSGKTFVMANVINQVQRPTLVMSPNKTLAAQLYGEYRQFFPHNAVEYFISYYDYYQPEAYVPEYDLYIEKEADINEEIERLRLRATASLLSRKDVIIVASVSCIYNIGEPREFADRVKLVKVGDELDREDLLANLVREQYSRNDYELKRSSFRVRGDVVEIWPAHEDVALRIEFFGEEIDSIKRFNSVSGKVIDEPESVMIFPARHFMVSEVTLMDALRSIEQEMIERVAELEGQGKLLEAQRLKTRTKYDIEMLREVGYCPGIENYSRHLSGRAPGSRPWCLLDYFPKDFLTIMDESHVGVPQVDGMYKGDRFRKENLVNHGFRLPSALDNRPLKFAEFETLVEQRIYTSATPGDYELINSKDRVIDLVVRPTGLVDPPMEIRPTANQVDDLIEEIRIRAERNERTLVTTLTKRMAEDLATYLAEMGLRVHYMHSEINALERVELLRGLRLGEFDVLVGINLLREGLDLPEVSLVAILDADKEGFLRDTRSLIQTSGRAARNVEGLVLLYADKVTNSMRAAIDESERRRKKQIKYNEEHGITPQTIKKSIQQVMATTGVADARKIEELDLGHEPKNEEERLATIARLQEEMKEAADQLDFEKAVIYRDRISELKLKIDKEILRRGTRQS